MNNIRIENKKVEESLLEIASVHCAPQSLSREYHFSDRKLKEMEAIFLREYHLLRTRWNFLDSADYSEESINAFTDIAESKRMIFQLLNTIHSTVFDPCLEDILKTQKYADRDKIDSTKVDIGTWFEITGSETEIEQQRKKYQQLYDKRRLS